MHTDTLVRDHVAFPQGSPDGLKLYGSLDGRFNPEEEPRTSRLESIISWKEGFLESSLPLQENNTGQTSANKNTRVLSFALPLRL